MTLEECKLACMNDTTCSSVDYGKNSRIRECYLNYGNEIKYRDHDDFDSYVLDKQPG